MNLTMFDAVPEGVPYLPRGGTYAGYIDGLYQSYVPIRQAHPLSIVLPITVLGATIFPHGVRLILDVENGNPVTPPHVPSWIRACLANGRTYDEIGVYANASTWGDIDLDLQVDGAGLPDDCRWVADWNGDPSIPPGYGAHQYTNLGGPNLGGQDNAYDISSVTLKFLGVNIPPPPPGADPNMVSITSTPNGGLVALCETQPPGPGKTGEVFALRTTAAWNDTDGIPWHGIQGQTSHLWESLGTPKP